MKSGRRVFAVIVCGVAAFIVYGSLVPFHFGPRTNSFGRVLADGVRISSRSDAVANVMLGVPLGFALLGLVSVDRAWPRRRVAGLGALLLPVCVLFSSAVEFAQLYTAERTCSASDIVAQGAGALAGMGAWVLWGQALTDRVRAVWARADVNASGQVLIAYLALLAFVQMLPLDLSASPAELYRKLRDTVRFAPFGAFDGLNDAERWEQIAKLAKLAGLYFPLGLLAARLKGHIQTWNIARVVLAAGAVALCLESAQLIVKSRTPSTTDALVGAVAAVLGWYAGRVHHEGLAIPFAVSWGVVWFAGMTPVTQSPANTPRLELPRPFDWVPGRPLESGDPLFTLEEVLTKLVLFGLLGVLVAAWRLPPRHRRGAPGSVRVAVVIATALGLAVSSFFESGQRWYDTHTPCITDVLLGGIGAAVGVVASSLTCVRRGGSPARIARPPVC
ncbi:VanZ family protein [Gemmata sp. G18]|uniref:VanZ family protein n=1 Tax=Gemmata palustris TaxID=2822762 RepID=A0ABS5C017_9BACT|nr:VanZ family protein [Gemmata palustris]MBP3959327.1 VanZ family protein [Gemmata palustris]